jgi:Protein of unknown function (DUF1189)
VRQFGILHPIVYSFFSRSLYRDVAWNWKGPGLLYLLLLLALAWIPAAVTLQRSVGAMVDNIGPLILEQIPTLTITDGTVSIEQPQPYLIKVPGSESPLAVIDTSAGATPQDFPEAMLLLTRHQLVLREKERGARIYDLSAIRSFRLDRARVESWGGWLRKWAALIFYPFLLLGSYAYRIVQVLLYGALGVLFARAVKVDLEYVDLMRLSAVAVTPAVLLDTLRGWMGWSTSYIWWFVCLIITMGYLLMAVQACATPPGEGPAAREVLP